ncbi:hypothetical protein [Paenibacillus mendelii]|uniref:Right handed beta helix domain-containing protein n=1 Tax=Paenibacillus mendelii TaxID=206163 RepID=A0ABV6J482_9BACL|nr:hypothetical protein [Paenibacillus mendelii]MCQ6559388.1 hypothetical protein [Paenibacillus mendelii]
MRENDLPIFKQHGRLSLFVLKASFLVIAFICAFLFTSATAKAADYYVDCSAAVNGTGTLASPYQGFADINAIGTLSAGDRVLLKSGVTCNQQLTVTGQGTASSFIEISSYGGSDKAKIIRNGLESDRAIKLSNPSFWKINNLEIGQAGTGILVTFSTAGHTNLFFTDLFFHDIKGIHQGSGSGNNVTGDAIWNSAGIEFTSKTFDSGHPASTYIVNNVTFDSIVGTRNLDTISIDWYNSAYMVATGHKAAENIIMKNLHFYDNDAGGGTATGCDDNVRLTSVRYLTLIDSNFHNNAACFSATGTAALYMAFVEDTYILNSIFTGVPYTTNPSNSSQLSPDRVAFDYECCTNNLQINNNYIANNAGAGISYLAIHPGLGLETNSVAAGNSFINNGDGSFRRAGTSDTPTGVIRDNFYYEPRNFLYQDGANYSGFIQSNNLAIAVPSSIYHSSYQFTGTQGENNWFYQHYNGTAWNNLGYYDSTKELWMPSSTVNVPQIGRFGMHPDAGTASITARVWKAPVTGTVSIRGRILKSVTTGGDGVAARITKNGTQIWPASGSQTVNYNNMFGVESSLNNITVSAGDLIRFEITSGAAGANQYDNTSWTPAVAYTTATNLAKEWDFNTSGYREGWANTNQMSSTVAGGS